jgi:hypothetical protein
MYGREGWLKQKRAGYSLFLERLSNFRCDDPKLSFAPKGTKLSEPVVEPRLESTQIDTSDPSFILNREYHTALVGLCKIRSELELMSAEYGGQDDQQFLDSLCISHGRVFAEFYQRERPMAKEGVVDHRWGQRVTTFADFKRSTL